MMSLENKNHLPKVVQDPRFRAGRILLQSGHPEQAFPTFATLLEESRKKYGDDHLESCPAYYEYGHALFRYACRRKEGMYDDNVQEEEQKETPMIDATKSEKDRIREAAAAAAMRRAQQQNREENHDKKQPAAEHSNDKKQSDKEKDDGKENEEGKEGDQGEVEKGEESIIDEDIQLALELMETAWAILEEYQLKENDELTIQYKDWVDEQVPRVLIGIGDVLSTLERHADAADAYSRALGYRQKDVETKFKTEQEKNTLEYLVSRRRLVETLVLTAEELLACPHDQDVVTTEAKAVLVKASEGVVDFARGYYNKARDELQETVLVLGQLAASKVDLKDEKENICFASTLLMALGETLAGIDEANEAEPVKKKAKTKK